VVAVALLDVWHSRVGSSSLSLSPMWVSSSESISEYVPSEPVRLPRRSPLRIAFCSFLSHARIVSRSMV
jgi:hypothetical protein